MAPPSPLAHPPFQTRDLHLPNLPDVPYPGLPSSQVPHLPQLPQLPAVSPIPSAPAVGGKKALRNRLKLDKLPGVKPKAVPAAAAPVGLAAVKAKLPKSVRFKLWMLRHHLRKKGVKLPGTGDLRKGVPGAVPAAVPLSPRPLSPRL